MCLKPIEVTMRLPQPERIHPRPHWYMRTTVVRLALDSLLGHVEHGRIVDPVLVAQGALWSPEGYLPRPLPEVAGGTRLDGVNPRRGDTLCGLPVFGRRSALKRRQVVLNRAHVCSLVLYLIERELGDSWRGKVLRVVLNADDTKKEEEKRKEKYSREPTYLSWTGKLGIQEGSVCAETI